MKLGVNIDHIATLREQRKEDDPNLLEAAKTVLSAGADGITIHLREDRRHIQDTDVFTLRKHVPRLNLEMAMNESVLSIARQVTPDYACLVPEKRQELTTEGGLNTISNIEQLKTVVKSLQNEKIIVSIFIDPDLLQIEAAKASGAQYIEIHTGDYANCPESEKAIELKRIAQAVVFATSIGLKVNAGHGLNYHNVTAITKIPNIEELNIGHSIVSKAIQTGLSEAVTEMKRLVLAAALC
ncbi:MAG: pyridoxine 5'-phosphate synthase [Candidatus Margulisbacteria bacterium]|nr:pyridoxine 5'-phosphate synthase [Candidatus Margulisiibacteriota bacterium]